MSMNTFGHLFRVTTWGESHGPALGATVDGCPPGIPVTADGIQQWLNKRKPGQSKHTTQRKEADEVEILSGVFEGVSTGTPIQLMIRNTDQRSRDYGDIIEKFRPGHADITYWQKYGIRDYRGGGRSSARETAARVAAGGVARSALGHLLPDVRITGYMVQMGELEIDRSRFDWDAIGRNDFWCPDPVAAEEFADHLDWLRKDDHNSVGAVIECVARGLPVGLGAPVYGKLDTIRAEFWAASAPARTLWCGSRSSRPRPSCRNGARSPSPVKIPPSSPRAATTPASVSVPCRLVRR